MTAFFVNADRVPKTSSNMQPAVKYTSVPLGDLTEATLEKMLRLAWEGKRDPAIKKLVVDEMTKLGFQNGRDHTALAQALAQWVADNIKFYNDPIRTETLQSPKKTIEFGYGDCDDMSILYAALLLCVGIEARFKVMGQGMAEHVFAEALVKNGWTGYDPAACDTDPPMSALDTFYIADFRGEE